MKLLDPRTKLFVGSAIILGIFFAKSSISLFGQLILILTAVLILKNIKPFVHGLKIVLPMVFLVFIIAWFSFDPIIALMLALRLFNLLIASFLIFQYISPEELAGGLRKMKIPFGFVFLITTAVRFVPLMQNKIRCIREAQISRGIDLRLKFKNIKNFMALLGPLLVQSFILADELAVAMEVRGYGCKNRSFRKEYQLGFLDYAVMVGASTTLAVFICWETRW